MRSNLNNESFVLHVYIFSSRVTILIQLFLLQFRDVYLDSLMSNNYESERNTVIIIINYINNIIKNVIKFFLTVHDSNYV